jgi:chromosome segregation ATPase
MDFTDYDASTIVKEVIEKIRDIKHSKIDHFDIINALEILRGIAESHEEEIDSLSSVNEDLEDEVDELKDRANELEDELLDRKDEIKELEKEVRILEKELEKLGGAK